MKIKKIFLIVLCFLSVVVQVFGKEEISKNTYKYTLDNGLSLFVTENHNVPLVYIEVAVRCGALTQTKETAGLFHLYEHMMFKGNSKYPDASSVQKALTDMGTASWNGTTGVECVNYFFTIPSTELENGLEFWSKAIREPNLDEKELETEKKVVISEIQGKVNDPEQKITAFLQSRLYGTAPWQVDPSGTVDNVQNCTVEDLKAIQKKFYTPQNSGLFVGGNVDSDEVYKLVNKYYGDWSNNGYSLEDIENVTVIQKEPESTEPLYVVIPYDKINPALIEVDIYLHGPDSDLDVASTYPADFFTNYFSDPNNPIRVGLSNDTSLGLLSRDYVWHQYLTQRRTGFTHLGAVMAAQNGDITNQAKNFYNKLYDELKKLTESESIISSQVHDAIVQRLQDSKLIEEETPQGILYDLRYWWVDCGADYSINYIENMKAVSNESLKKYINEYLLNRRPVIFLYVNPQLYEAQSTYFRLSNFININDYEPFWFMQNK